MSQQFHVVVVHGKDVEPCCYANGNPIVFSNALQATNYAQEMSYITGHKHQPRPIPNDVDWRKREQDRMDSGHYIKLPWHKEAWVKQNPTCEHHYPHVSKNDNRLIAYIADEKKAIADVHSVAKPSKYLMTFYSKILSQEVIREWNAAYRKLYDKDNVIHFAYTADEIEKVYRTGPQSCMKNPALRSNIHPVRAYAGPDLAVAYIKRGRAITTRALCWPEKKLYGRIYGDAALLTMLFQEEGWEYSDLAGARLTKIKQGNRIICPYIDFVKRVKVGRKWLYISHQGKRAAANQDGFCGQGFNCGFCEPGHAEHDAQKPNGQAVRIEGMNCCQTCYAQMRHNELLRRCAYTGQEGREAHMVQTVNGFWVLRAYMNDAVMRCQTCKELWLRRDMHTYYICRSCHFPQKEMPF